MYFFSFSYIPMHDLLKKKNIQRKIKSKKIKMFYIWLQVCILGRCESYRMYLESDSPHQTVMNVCELKWFSYISNCHNMYTLMQSCDIFYTQHAIFFATFDICAGTRDFAITRFTCVNVWSLNCLDLFLKYKIG